VGLGLTLKSSFDGLASKEHTPLERLEPMEHSIFTLFNSQRLYQIQQMGFVHAKNPRRSRAIPLRVSKRLSDDVGSSTIHSVAIRKRSIGPLDVVHSNAQRQIVVDYFRTLPKDHGALDHVS
jgi:hypothetical protein